MQQRGIGHGARRVRSRALTRLREPRRELPFTAMQRPRDTIRRVVRSSNVQIESEFGPLPARFCSR